MSSDFRQSANNANNNANNKEGANPSSSFQGEDKKKIVEEVKKKIEENLKKAFDEGSIERKIEDGMGMKGMDKTSLAKESREDKISRIKGEARDKAGQGLKKSRFASLNNKMNAMNEDMRRKMQNIKNESLVPAKERQKEIEEKIQKQKNEIANKFNARKRAMLEKARKLKKAAGIEGKKSNMSSGTVKFIFIATLALALIVDVIDIIGLLGVGMAAIPTIIAYIINFCSSIIISLSWFMVFSGSKGKNNKQSKVIIRSIFILFGLENIPIVELLPFNAIAVILNYLDYKEGNKPDKG